MAVTFNDYSDEVLEAFSEACLRALERCGQQAEGYAKDLVPVDTGNLRNSISHKVDPAEPAAYIGTNSEYAAYVEFGTGQYSSIGGGTPKDHWVYKGDDGACESRRDMRIWISKLQILNHSIIGIRIGQESFFFSMP